MKTYKIYFEGVKLGVIGKKQKFTLTIEAENLKEATYKMYDTHEHIRILKVNGESYSYVDDFEYWRNY